MSATSLDKSVTCTKVGHC